MSEKLSHDIQCQTLCHVRWMDNRLQPTGQLNMTDDTDPYVTHMDQKRKVLPILIKTIPFSFFSLLNLALEILVFKPA